MTLNKGASRQAATAPLCLLRAGALDLLAGVVQEPQLPPIKDLVKLVETHWDGIVGWHNGRISNELPEGTNSLVEAAKPRADGYRSKINSITIIYHHLPHRGKFPNPSPSVAHTI